MEGTVLKMFHANPFVFPFVIQINKSQLRFSTSMLASRQILSNDLKKNLKKKNSM